MLDVLNSILGNLQSMMGNLYPGVVVPVGTLILGMLVIYFLSQKKINQRDDYIEELEDTVESRDKNIKTLNKSLKEREGDVDSLNEELSRHKEAIISLKGQAEERDNQISSLNEEMNDLSTRAERAIEERDEKIKEMDSSLKTSESELRNLKRRLREKEVSLENLNTELVKRDESIIGLEDQLKERDEEIGSLKEDIADMTAKNQESTGRAERAETRVGELDNALQESEHEVANLKAKGQAMQDNFTYLNGIGPKVASILRLGGIKSFAKLAATDVKKIKAILEKENPSLLRLTDPTTWPKQAKMAEEGEWEALKELQESLKESRRQERAAVQQPPEMENTATVPEA
jgi:chromosome segregation ATPase